MEKCQGEKYLFRKISSSNGFSIDVHIQRSEISRGIISPEEAFRVLENEEGNPFGPVLSKEIKICFDNISKGNCNRYPLKAVY